MNEKTKKIIENIQTLTDELAFHATHPDEFLKVSDLQNDLHKVRQAFDTQINNEGEN
ncbi:hypothetical protein LCGC14_0420910 [marine sediment metagenome]|uniref:Uncharacterized protein n=1 Tax=marine sediment metagenome TaxID=412755 RepID=A0A0F9SWW8_9ZZZZ